MALWLVLLSETECPAAFQWSPTPVGMVRLVCSLKRFPSGHLLGIGETKHPLGKHTMTICFVCQENVSCLNTTLVFLMFANQKNRLPQYLRALSQDRTGSGECSSSCNIMKNFRDLLLFWQDHYLHKDKDCSALEKVSKITGSELKQLLLTVSISSDVMSNFNC